MSNVTPRASRATGKAGRRGNGDGSLTRRDDGAYIVRISLPDGKRRKKIVSREQGETAYQHERRADSIAKAMLREAEAGHTVPSGHQTVASYAALWLDRERAKSDAGRGMAPNTVEFYRQMFAYYVLPSVGTRPLPDLTLGDVEQMMNTLASEGRSSRTVQASRNALGRLLRSARLDGLVSRVVTDGASRVRRSVDDNVDPTSKALQPDEARALFEEAEGTRWEAPIVTLAFLGLRRGEALGLRWSDVDLETGIITIRRSLARVRRDGRSTLVLSPTKTKGSLRPLPIPPPVAAVLRSWRSEQAKERLRCGQGWGNGTWADDDLVFTTPIGTPIDPDNFRHALDRIGKACGIGHVFPHQLRHTVASMLIAGQFTPPEVCKVMGHSNPSVTLSVYAHAFDRAAVKAIGTITDQYAAAGSK
jgi:integrase